jgi:hypothetical protein
MLPIKNPSVSHHNPSLFFRHRQHGCSVSVIVYLQVYGFGTTYTTLSELLLACQELCAYELVSKFDFVLKSSRLLVRL